MASSFLLKFKMADGQLEQTLEEVLKSIKHVILVLTGKGGVGKSTVKTQMAWTLYNKGKRLEYWMTMLTNMWTKYSKNYDECGGKRYYNSVQLVFKQFLLDVCWGDLDYLIIDTPPGTSDEHIAVVENLQHYNPDGAILVTTPQECTNVFSKGGGDALANSCDVPFLGSILLDSSLTQSLEESQAFIDLFPNSPTLNAVNVVTSKLLQMESSGDQ